MITLALTVIMLEGMYICFKLDKEEDEKTEVRTQGRREIKGSFDPYGYHKNTKGQLKPIRPYSKMLDGDEEDEE